MKLQLSAMGSSLEFYRVFYVSLLVKLAQIAWRDLPYHTVRMQDVELF